MHFAGNKNGNFKKCISVLGHLPPSRLLVDNGDRLLLPDNILHHRKQVISDGKFHIDSQKRKWLLNVTLSPISEPSFSDRLHNINKKGITGKTLPSNKRDAAMLNNTHVKKEVVNTPQFDETAPFIKKITSDVQIPRNFENEDLQTIVDGKVKSNNLSTKTTNEPNKNTLMNARQRASHSANSQNLLGRKIDQLKKNDTRIYLNDLNKNDYDQSSMSVLSPGNKEESTTEIFNKTKQSDSTRNNFAKSNNTNSRSRMNDNFIKYEDKRLVNLSNYIPINGLTEDNQIHNQSTKNDKVSRYLHSNGDNQNIYFLPGIANVSLDDTTTAKLPQSNFLDTSLHEKDKMTAHVEKSLDDMRMMNLESGLQQQNGNNLDTMWGERSKPIIADNLVNRIFTQMINSTPKIDGTRNELNFANIIDDVRKNTGSDVNNKYPETDNRGFTVEIYNKNDLKNSQNNSTDSESYLSAKSRKYIPAETVVDYMNALDYDLQTDTNYLLDNNNDENNIRSDAHSKFYDSFTDDIYSDGKKAYQSDYRNESLNTSTGW